ncbi:MAG: family ATPase [Ramlibacter sp.]|nr:family ATPase [Ramlibacter sp.]
MIIYQAEKKQFLDDVFKNDIEAVVLDSFKKRTGHTVSKEEMRAWTSSLGYMGKVLNDDGVPDDCGVAIEYTIPQTSKRVDFLLTGKSAGDQSCVIIVELKQWEHATKTEKDAIVSTRFSRGEAEVSHPSYQAWSYAALLQGFNEAVYDGGIELKPCAYLHNYPLPGGDINDPFYADHIKRAPVFLKGDSERTRLREFIQRHVRFGDKGEALYRMEKGRIRPSKSLADGLAGMLKGNSEFVLVDDQKLVYETALQQARQVQEKGKRVLIVEGGPGTGKSVVAINLLVGLTEAGLVAKYVTKNAAPRAVYEARLVGTFKKTHISNLFTGSGAFTSAAENEFDALVVDEAHRLNEKSGLYANLGDNQIKELIQASRFSVFFIDESQKVTLKDIGDKETIKRWAKHFGAKVSQMDLASQFRCNGSDGYLAWLDHNLQVRETANELLDVAEFDFRIVDSPVQLRDLIVDKNKERNRARMVAGYCWSWPSKKDRKAFDIVIPEHDFKARWNLTQDGGLWIVSPDSVNEIGCIHTCQGLEVDYIGVIIGDDLIVRDGKVVVRPDRRASSDKSIHGLKQLTKENPAEAARQADAIIKNTYRTLMTRGMKGCYVYFTDEETADYYRSRLRGWRPTVIETQRPSVASRLQELVDPRPFRVIPNATVIPYRNAVPVIPLKMAAGTFSGAQILDPEAVEWAVPEGISIGPDMFIAQVVGESMNRRIPNGAWCLFRGNPVGTRQGKVVLAQHRDIADPETGGTFTVKIYSSEKAGDGHKSWAHTHITLSPSSSDAAFQPIVLQAQSATEVTVLAELIAVLA